MRLAITSSFAAVAAAAVLPSLPSWPNLEPTVVFSNGTVIGSRSNGLETFKGKSALVTGSSAADFEANDCLAGVPFAQPPLGNLRLRPPQPLKKSFGTIRAVNTAKSCPQFPFSTNTGSALTDALTVAGYNPNALQNLNTGEDCLTLDIYRPANLPASTKLPVVFYVLGGGFAIGSSGIIDGSTMVQKSVEIGAPIIFIVGQHRLGGFGFLPGKEISADGSSNLGLKDQRATMQWIQENIAAFGGDPDRVTIWGPSSGAVSVFTHTLVNGGNHMYKGKPLFNGVIMNSGTVIPISSSTAPKAQDIYDRVVAYSGCNRTQDSLACLRSLDYEKFQNAVDSVPSSFGYKPLDLSYTPRPDPSDDFYNVSPEISLQQGKYTRVPILVSDVEDEGTYFAIQVNNLTTVDNLIDYFTSYFPANASTREVVRKLVDTYSTDPADGAPYYTGNNWQLYPQYKRLASVIGDAVFLLQRRYYLSIVSSQIKAWSFYTANNRNTGPLGTWHGTDGYPPLNVFGLAPTNVGQTLLRYYISFVNHLDPNALGTAAPLIPWPVYTVENPQLLKINQFSNDLLPDTFRNASYKYLVDNLSRLRF